MTAPLPMLERLQPNPDWAKLPIFDRKGWKTVRFGDVVENLNETCDAVEAGLQRFIGLEHLEPGSLHIRTWGNVADGTTFTRRCRPGQVLFGKRRAYQRKVAVVEFDAVVSGDIYVFTPKNDQLLPEFLPFLCLSERFFQHAVGTSAGSLSPRTNWSSLARFEFVLPHRDHQRRIAEILWAVDRSLDAHRDCLNAAQDVRTAKLFALYRRGIGHSEFVETALGQRPRGWEVAPLERRYEVQLGKMMSPKAVAGASKRPYIRNANVQWNRLDLSDVATMSFTPRETKKFDLRSGDILACEGRHVGKSALWRDEIPGACYQKALHRIRARDSNQVPEFLLFQMEHHSLSGIFADRTGETTIPHLPAERLRQIPFCFPPRDEQQQIATEIQDLDAVVSALRIHIGNMDALLSVLSDSVVESPAGTP